MRQKLALAFASLAATATLAVALVTATAAPPAVPPASADPTAAATPIVQIDTVYLQPAPTQEVVTIQQPASGEADDEGEGSEGEDD